MKAVRNLSKLGALAAVAAAAAGVAGCGSSSNAKSASGGNVKNGNINSIFARAADVSASAAGEKIVYTMNGTAGSEGSFSMTGKGAFNSKPVSGSMQMTVNAAGHELSGISFLIANKTMYMKFPSAMSGELSSVTGGKQWMSINIGELGSAANIPGLSSLMNGSEINPTEELKILADSSTNGLTKVGTATINGVSTTQYKATLNLAKEANAIPTSNRAAIKALLAKDGKEFGSTNVPVNVWIDGSDLVRQMTMDLTIKADGQSVPMTMKMNILDYGKQPAVTPPPASETYDMTNLLKQEAASGALTTG